MTTKQIFLSIIAVEHTIFLGYAVYLISRKIRKYIERKNNKIQNKSFYDRLMEEEKKNIEFIIEPQYMEKDMDSHLDVIKDPIAEAKIKEWQENVKVTEPTKITSATLDHVSIGVKGIGLGLSNIEYKDHAQDSVEMLKYFADDDLKINADFEEQSNIESNASDTCSDNSSVDYGGGDSGGSGSGNDF